MIEEEEIQELEILVENGSDESEEEYAETLEGGRPWRSHRCKIAVSLAMLLVVSVAIVMGPVSGLFRKNDTLTRTAKPNNHVIGKFGFAGQDASIALSVAAPSAPASVDQTVAVAAGSCSKSDEAIISNLPAGSGAGSIGLATYECFMQHWSMFSLVDRSAFSQCMHEKTKISTSCGSCYADYSKFGITHCAMQCAASWCSSECLQCNSQYKSSLDTCTGFIGTPQIACDLEAVTARKLGDKVDPIAV